MFIRAIFLIIALLPMQVISFAEPISGSQVLRSQELISQEQALRDKTLEYKVFIKKIVITGVTLLSEEKIKELTLPFENKWLSRADIQEIEDLIIQEYINIGKPKEAIRLSSKIENGVLEIRIEEVKKP